jgi:hypothetical protein
MKNRKLKMTKWRERCDRKAIPFEVRQMIALSPCPFPLGEGKRSQYPGKFTLPDGLRA